MPKFVKKDKISYTLSRTLSEDESKRTHTHSDINTRTRTHSDILYVSEKSRYTSEYTHVAKFDEDRTINDFDIHAYCGNICVLPLDDGHIVIVDWQARVVVCELTIPHDNIASVARFVYEADMRATRVVTGGYDSKVFIYDMKTGDIIYSTDFCSLQTDPKSATICNPPFVTCMHMCGFRMCVGRGDGTVILMSNLLHKTPNMVMLPIEHSSALSTIAWSYAGDDQRKLDYIITAASDRKLILYGIPSASSKHKKKRTIQVLQQCLLPSKPNSCVFGPPGHFLVADTSASIKVLQFKDIQFQGH